MHTVEEDGVKLTGKGVVRLHEFVWVGLYMSRLVKYFCHTFSGINNRVP